MLQTIKITMSIIERLSKCKVYIPVNVTLILEFQDGGSQKAKNLGKNQFFESKGAIVFFLFFNKELSPK